MTTARHETAGPTDEPAELLGQVARLFFERQLTKVEIAARLGISRFRVARLLDRALAEGVVRIEFRDAPARDRVLGARVAERFGIGRCVVAAADAPATAVARLGAEVVDGLLEPGEAIGIAWGSTVARVVGAMPGRQDPSIDVIQLAGSSTSLDASSDPGDLTRVLAERLGARHHRIHAPAFVQSADLRAALLRQAEVADTAKWFDAIAVALVGIGAFGATDGAASSSLLRSGALSTADASRLARLGAVGDLLVHPFTADGAFVAPDLADGPSPSRSTTSAGSRASWPWRRARRKSARSGAPCEPASSGCSSPTRRRPEASWREPPRRPRLPRDRLDRDGRLRRRTHGRGRRASLRRVADGRARARARRADRRGGRRRGLASRRPHRRGRRRRRRRRLHRTVRPDRRPLLGRRRERPAVRRRTDPHRRPGRLGPDARAESHDPGPGLSIRRRPDAGARSRTNPGRAARSS